MRRRRNVLTGLLLAALAASSFAASASSAAAADKKVLKLGWSNDSDTLNPFVSQLTQSYQIWALTWDFLTSFSPKDLTPQPGLAKSWTVSPDKRTITFTMIQGAKWSDGQPITAADVKYSLSVFAPNSLNFAGYVENVTSVTTPDPSTVVVKLSKPDARIIGDLYMFMLPAHIWSKVPLKTLKSSYQPKLPMVGSGPYVVTQYSRNHIIKLERNPTFRGPKPLYDEIDYIKYGSQDAADRALTLGEVDVEPTVQGSSAARLGAQKGITVVTQPSQEFDELAFNVCSPADCPSLKRNPALRDATVRNAISLAIDRGKINTIAYRGTGTPANGILPPSYTAFYTPAGQSPDADVAKANAMLDAAGWARGSDGIRARGGVKLSFGLDARTEAPDQLQAARLVAEQTKAIGVRFNVQPMSGDKLTDLIYTTSGDKPAPAYDTFIWDWVGDPYDPSVLLGVLQSKEIGHNADAMYSNAEYDSLYTQQAAEFDVAKRKALVARMIAILQRDQPYIFLNYPSNIEAYRSDRLGTLPRVCPAATGDVLCQQLSYEPILTLGQKPTAAAASSTGGAASSSAGGAATGAAAAPASTSSSGGGSNTGAIVGGVVVIAILAVGAVVLVTRRRGHGDDELEEEL